MSETGKQEKPTSTAEKQPTTDAEMMNPLMQDLAEISKSLSQIKKEMTRSIKRIQNFGRRKSSFFISNEFIEKMRDAKVRMNALEMFAAHNFSINFEPPARKCIQLEIQRCALLFKKPDFEVNSIPHKMYQFDWFLRAKRTENGHLGLFLHAEPADGFKGHWRIEADTRLSIWNKLPGKKLVKEDQGTVYGQDGDERWHTAKGYREMAKLTDLLNPRNGFLRSNGSIKVDVNFKLINLCEKVNFTDMTGKKNAAATTAVNDDEMEFVGMVDILMADLAEIMESHNQITKELARIQKNGKSDSVIIINYEFIVRTKQLKGKLNILKLLVATSVNIKPIQKIIQLELLNCQKLFAKKKFSKCSKKIKVLQFNWFLEACREEKGFLCLILYAEPPAGFNSRYRIEIDDCYSVLTELAGKKLLDEKVGTVFENDAKDPEHIHTGVGYPKLARFEHLLDPARGYLRTDGSIKFQVDFVVNSSTLNHLA